MEGNNDSSPPPSADVSPSARAGEAGLAHRRVSDLTVFLLDTLTKALSIIFWYTILAPIFDACRE